MMPRRRVPLRGERCRTLSLHCTAEPGPGIALPRGAVRIEVLPWQSNGFPGLAEHYGVHQARAAAAPSWRVVDSVESDAGHAGRNQRLDGVSFICDSDVHGEHAEADAT